MARSNRNRRSRLAAGISSATVLVAAPASAAISGLLWPEGRAFVTLNGDIVMPLLSVLFAVAGVTRMMARKG